MTTAQRSAIKALVRDMGVALDCRDDVWFLNALRIAREISESKDVDE